MSTTQTTKITHKNLEGRCVNTFYAPSALYYLRHLSLARSLKDYAGIARAYNSLAAVYTNMGEFSKAAYFLACNRALGKEVSTAVTINAFLTMSVFFIILSALHSCMTMISFMEHSLS
ncbi:unnamed protein product [Heligmosomoides polygyrus]|uniref:TPR_REGION domain-containing protein n=1 Tax=Heligmosomoides polygyrus TaxID=6339 RepID=A0A3P8CA40_HELPZ|nr:unnamed protein product [Heligmosomoides polygyrus]